jgi:hypothetical protein
MKTLDDARRALEPDGERNALVAVVDELLIPAAARSLIWGQMGVLP